MDIRISVDSPLERDASQPMETQFTADIPVPSVEQYHDPNFNLLRFVPSERRVEYGAETVRWADLPVLVAQALTEAFWVELGKAARSLAKQATTPPTE